MHRIYIGKISGLLFIFTAGGFFGLWPLYDLIVFAAGRTKDKDGRPLKITVGERVSAVIVYIGCVIVSVMMLFALGVLGKAAGEAVREMDKSIQQTNEKFRQLDEKLEEQRKKADEDLRKAEEELKRIEGEAQGQ